ncbi:serine/threonine-protein kinase [Sorangium sp. So ce388]|uniref:serine/threonine-protein kinase n=1 Tax=Sorangium sp. So ce388 TaxID=3133309 RepID=UPI003F5BA523
MTPETVIAARYRIVRRLGAGAMGAVYEAVDLQTARRRALKVMHPHTVERDDLRERFKLEARVAGQVDSPALVDVLDAGVDDATGTPFLVMELLRGETLSQRLARVGRRAPEEVLTYLGQSAPAIDKMHRLGIVHRDLKPSNLFLEQREDGAPRLKILDFGVAKVLHEGATRGSTGAAGTPIYMAPEQFQSGRITSVADIYALGMIAFTLLTGRPYWEEEVGMGDSPVAFALIALHGPKEPACARAARVGVTLPPAFDAWFARATALAPDQRFPTAGATVEALARALGVPGYELFAEQAVEAEAPEPARAAADPSMRSEATRADGPRGGGSATTRTDSEVSGAAVPAERTGSEPARDTPSETLPQRLQAVVRRPRWRRWIVASGVTLATVGVGTAWLTMMSSGPLWRLSPPPVLPPLPAVVPSPLAPDDAVLACPILEASGVEEPAGWLGAAAAATLCERARVILGGSAARTLVPAELLSIPRPHADAYPVEPYAGPEARARSLETARRRAAAYVDGTVVLEPSRSFRLTLTLRAADGGELASSVGRGSALYEAVRNAMDPWVEAGPLPKAPRLDDAVADFSRARTVDAALDELDLTLAMTHNAGGLRQECARFEARGGGLAEMGPGERFRCAYTLGEPVPEVALPPASATASPGELAARARVDLMMRRTVDPSAVAELQRLYDREPSTWGRSTVAATLSCVLPSPDEVRATEMTTLAKDMAFSAVQAEPKNPIGEWCAPWLQLATVTHGTPSATSALQGMRAWMPWEAYGWLFEDSGSGEAEPPAHDARKRALRFARRAYVLSPLDMNVADTLVDRLLQDGARQEARGIALAVAQGTHAPHKVGSELLLVRVEASEARIGAALERARRAMAVSTDDSGFVRVQRLQIAWHALELALVLGREREIADLIVALFLDPEPPPLEGTHISIPLRIGAICARASRAVSRRCFERFRKLRVMFPEGELPNTESFITGAERYARGDHGGAALAWRPLLQEPEPFVEVLGDAMVVTYEREGAHEVAHLLEEAIPADSQALNGASLKTVREAERAARRGDKQRALDLAQQVIKAWSVADAPVPAVESMRRLVARLRD